MKNSKKVLILLTIVASILLILVACGNNNLSKHKVDNEVENTVVNQQIGNEIKNSNNQEELTTNNKREPIQTVSQIEINSKQFINQLEKVKIKGTDDTIMITERFKWEEVPEDGLTKDGDFVLTEWVFPVPYTFTVDGKDYNGIFVLNYNYSIKAVCTYIFSFIMIYLIINIIIFNFIYYFFYF